TRRLFRGSRPLSAMRESPSKSSLTSIPVHVLAASGAELATSPAKILEQWAAAGFPLPDQNFRIYTIPEISMTGRTEETLTSNRVPYEVGIAKYSELAKSMMLGDDAGMLKLLFDRQTPKLLGVHAIGQRATEIIHIGQAVMFYGGSVEYFRDTVFNYPTLAEAYKVAALDGLNKLN